MGLRDDLIAAKALIEDPARWRKGFPRGDTYCAMKAVNEITNGARLAGPRWSEANDALCRAVPRHIAMTGHPVVTFNDDPSTTHADILALFDRAITAAES